MSSSSGVFLAIIGVGGVGTHFLQQVPNLPSSTRPHLIYASRSKVNYYDVSYKALDLNTLATNLSSSKTPILAPPALIKYLSNAPGPVVLVDNTSSQEIADAYPSFLEAGISVVTPNKKAFSSDLTLWDGIFNAAGKSHGKALVYHESSVGAGLPVISTLNDLIATGDQVTKIIGVFSGTMSFLFNSFAPADSPGSNPGASSKKWSQIVSEAKTAGYTEPDPRDDLNGMDVARKLTILARLAGLRVNGPSAFPVHSLIPSQLESISSPDDFMAQLPHYDGEMERYKDDAKKQGKCVRYVGTIDVGRQDVKVGLEMVDLSSPIAGLKGSDNLICFYTRRYGANPLVIQGAGAGGEVTAMGVTADLIKVVQRVSGR